MVFLNWLNIWGKDKCNKYQEQLLKVHTTISNQTTQVIDHEIICSFLVSDLLLYLQSVIFHVKLWFNSADGLVICIQWSVFPLLQLQKNKNFVIFKSTNSFLFWAYPPSPATHTHIQLTTSLYSPHLSPHPPLYRNLMLFQNVTGDFGEHRCLWNSIQILQISREGVNFPFLTYSYLISLGVTKEHFQNIPRNPSVPKKSKQWSPYKLGSVMCFAEKEARFRKINLFNQHIS